MPSKRYWTLLGADHPAQITRARLGTGIKSCGKTMRILSMCTTSSQSVSSKLLLSLVTPDASPNTAWEKLLAPDDLDAVTHSWWWTAYEEMCQAEPSFAIAKAKGVDPKVTSSALGT